MNILNLSKKVHFHNEMTPVFTKMQQWTKIKKPWMIF